MIFLPMPGQLKTLKVSYFVRNAAPSSIFEYAAGTWQQTGTYCLCVLKHHSLSLLTGHFVGCYAYCTFLRLVTQSWTGKIA